jgi:hypothetical protein
MNVSRPAIALAAAIACISGLGVVGVMAGAPRVWSPLPAITIIPMFLALEVTGEPHELQWISLRALPMLIGPILLFAWHPRLVSGASGVPRRSWWGLSALTLLTAVAFWGGWDYGLQYQSRAYVLGVLALNLVLLVTAWALLAWTRKHPSPTRTLISHAWVVAWLVWVAFPWMGELP